MQEVLKRKPYSSPLIKSGGDMEDTRYIVWFRHLCPIGGVPEAAPGVYQRADREDRRAA
jgi:hypothetical protein